MFLQILLVVTLSIPAYFLYLYIKWLIIYYQEKQKDLPIAIAHFVHPNLPFAELLGKPTPLEMEKLIFETSKKYNTPFVKVIHGFYINTMVV